MSQGGGAKGQGVRRSVTITVVTRYSMLVVSTVATMILARLLTPAEIGLFSLAAIFMNLAHSVRAFGVGQYIVQEQELTRERLGTAFGISLVIAWSLALLMYLISPLAAQFYGEPGIESVLQVLALNFLIIPFGSIVLAMINREMRFGLLMRISVTAELARHVVSIGLAVLGFGYMSLAWGAVAGVSATVLLTQFFSPRRMKVVPGFGEWRRVLNFGGYATVAAIAKDLQDGSPELVIGKAMDTTAVGLYGKAVAVNKLFDKVVLSAVRPAVLPHMSAKHRAGEPIWGFYTHGVALTTALAWPFYAFVAVMAFPLVRVLYGDQWDAAIPVARFVCAYAAIDVVFAFSGQALVSVGAVSRLVRLRLVAFAVTLATVIAAVPYGLTAVALAMTIPATVGFTYSYVLLRRHIGLRVRPYVRALLHSALVAVMTALFPLYYSTTDFYETTNVLVTLLVGAAGTGIAWLLGVLVTRHPIAGELRLVVEQVRGRIARRGG